MMASALDLRIVIQAKTSAQDESFGGAVETWEDVVTVWAQYLPGGGNERFAAAQVYAETQARFRLRWRDDVTVQNRITFEGKTYDILAVDEIGRRHGLELKVKAHV
jgi:SPP1 family predicted phage head-tail adaptor